MVQFGTQSGNQENRASKCVTFEQMVQSGTQSGNPENRTFKKFYGAKTGPSKNFTGPKRSLKIRASKSVTFGQMVQFGTQSGNQENRASKCVTFEQMVHSGTQSGNPENRTFKKFYRAKKEPQNQSLKICHFWANGPVWDTNWQPRKQDLQKILWGQNRTFKKFYRAKKEPQNLSLLGKWSSL